MIEDGKCSLYFIGFIFPLSLIFIIIQNLVDIESYTNNVLLTHVSYLSQQIMPKVKMLHDNHMQLLATCMHMFNIMCVCSY